MYNKVYTTEFVLRTETSWFLKVKVFLFKGNWQWDSHRNLLYFWRNQWNGQVSKNFQVHLQIKFCLHLRGRNTFEGYILTNIIDNFKWEKVNLLKNYLNENLICNFWNKYGLEMIIHCQALVQVISGSFKGCNTEFIYSLFFGNNYLKSSINSKSWVSFEICWFWGFQNWPYFWYLVK